MHPAPTSSTRNVRPPRLKACALAPLHSRWDPVHRSRKRGAQACCRKPRPGREFRPIHTEVLLAGRARAEKMAGRSGPSDAEGAGATERAEKAGGSAGVPAGAVVGGPGQAGRGAHCRGKVGPPAAPGRLPPAARPFRSSALSMASMSPQPAFLF